MKATLASAPISGDPALIRRLIANLLDNAIRHNDERGLVAISTGSRADEAYVAVENTGPTLPSWALERLFEPFRGSGDLRTARANGHHGLGLSISSARSPPPRRGSHVEAEPRDDGGLKLTVSFPRADGLSADLESGV